jgi:glycosyltransferase involved in cell wall biosynthesis
VIAPDRTAVTELELAGPLAPLQLPAPAAALQVLVRLRGRPVGWVSLPLSGEARLAPESIRSAIVSQVGWDLVPELLSGPALPVVAPPSGEPISVVVCTRDRPEELDGCLSALRSLRYPQHEVLVVDNASTGVQTAAVAARHGVRYVREMRPGLDWARNRGIRESRHPIVAFTDDDARVDPLWLDALAAAFAENAVDAVTGLVAPLELETEAQRLFEHGYGGMGKGFRRRVFSREQLGSTGLLRIQNAGVGANMAFRRSVFSTVGEFDPALDVGTPAHGGGDLDMFHRVVAGGHRLLYEPAALVWHRHRRSLDQLERQLGDDGRAFTIYLMKTFRTRSVGRRAVASFFLRHWAAWLMRRFVRGVRGREHLPVRMLWAPISGMLAAPLAGRRARRAAARA